MLCAQAWSALKGETVPDSLPATPKSPPTRRFIRASYILCVSSLPLLPFFPQICGPEKCQIYVSGPNLVLLHCWEYGRPFNTLWAFLVAQTTREESGVLGFPSRRGLTPRGSLECNPEIPAFPGEEN